MIFFLTLSQNLRVIEDFIQNTDQELLVFIQRGNEQAFTTLYKRYYGSLCKKAFRHIPSMSAVEEIVQDVFVNFWFKAASLDIEGNIRAYLYATLRNKILHELRSASTRSFYSEKLKKLGQASDDGGCLDAIFARETEAKLVQVIETLSPQCRQAFWLSRFNGLSYKEIAEHMQVSIKTIEKHVAKALKLLRSRFHDYGDIGFLFFLLFLTCNR